MMKKGMLIILIFSCIVNVYGQRQTYKGNYVLDGYDSPTIERDRKGTVEYEYIEVNNERVLDGYFTYTDQFGSLNGYFKNGLKDGAWVYANNLGVYARKNFKSGKLDGLCESGDLKLNLKDNHFIGSFTYTKNRTTYTGQFNQNGYADGDWVIDSYRSGIRYIRTLKWENGTLVSDIEFDESTGKKIDYLDRKSVGTPQAYNDFQGYIIEHFERKVQLHPVYEYYEKKSKHSNLPKRGMYMGEYPMTTPPFKGTVRLKSSEKAEKERKEKAEREEIQKATALYQEEKYSEAIETCKKTIERNPNNADAYRVMGNSYFMIKGNANAIEALKKSIELKPTNVPSTTYLELGISYYREKYFSNAIEAFQKVIHENIDNLGIGFIYRWLGDSYAQEKKYFEAIESYQKAINLKTEDIGEVYVRLGISFNQIEQFSDAIKAFQEAIELDQNDKNTYHHLGFSYFKLEQFTNALNAYKKFIELNPNLATGYYMVGRSYNKLGNNKEALKAFQRAAELGEEEAIKRIEEIKAEKK